MNRLKIGVLLLAMVLLPAWSFADDFLEKSLGDFSEELDLAKSKGKKGVLIFFEQEGCPYCHKMKTTIFNKSDVQKYFSKHFLVFSVDIKRQEEIKDFQGKETTQKQFFYRISNNRDATPVMAFFDLQGKMVVRYIGATADAKEFMMLGAYAATKAYTKKPFSKYKIENKNNLSSK